jgi:3-hydroxybutyryl-CoA dehydratase
MEISTIEKTITQDQINSYAEASGDFNPIHVDEAFAKKSQYGKNIAHGMMIAATISELMAIISPETWPKTGNMKIRFKAPVYPGDTITTSAKVQKITETPEGKEMRYSVTVKRQTGEVLISGSTSVIT